MAAPAAAQAPVSGLQINADHLELASQDGRELRLRGNVRVRANTTPRGAVSIRASQMTVRLDAKGAPLSLEAAGPVTVQVGPSRGTARQMRMRMRTRTGIRTMAGPGQPADGTGVVELLGQARLKVGRLQLAGQAIRLELETGRVSVERARVDLASPLPPVSPTAADVGGAGASHGG